MNVAALRRRKAPIVSRTSSADGPTMNFRVDLEMFRGPLDLLLYLVRKHEVDVLDLPIALIADQYCAHLEVLERLDIDGIGEFLEMASTLVEIKSRLALPHADEVEEPMEDPRQDLVRQLLEYKKFRDAAAMLEDRSRSRQEHFSRLADDRPKGRGDLADEAIHEVELWDLVSAFSRVIREHQGGPQTSIVYDDTPIHVYMERIAELLNRRGTVALGELFEAGMHKSKLVGMFLAILELARHHSVKTEQGNLFGEIYVYPGPQGTVSVDPSAADEYDRPHADDSSESATETESATGATAVADRRNTTDAAHAETSAPHFAGETKPAAGRKSRAKKPK